METYTVLSQVDEKGKVKVRRKSDGLVTRCKLSWLTLVPDSDGVYQAKSKTKDLWLDILDWTVEV